MSSTASVVGIGSSRRLKVAVTISVAFFVAYFDRTNVTVLLADHHFTADLGISDSKFQQGLLLTAFLLPYGLCNFVVGPIADKIGGRRALIFSIIAWTVLMVAMGSVSSFIAMLVLRVILGLGESVMTPACNLIVAEWFPDKERARANSSWLTGLFLAPAISFPIIVAMVNLFGWRASFYILALIGIVIALPMALAWTTDRPEQHRAMTDSELHTIRSGQLAVQQVPDLRERLREMFGNYRYWITVFSYIGYGVGFWGITTFVPSYLENERGQSFSTSGVMSVAPWLAAAVLAVVFGLLGDRFPSRRVLLWSGGYLLAALLSFVGVRVGTLSLSIVFISAAVGFTASTLPPMWSVIQEIVPRGITGMGTGIVNGVSYVAASVGPALVGALVDATGSYNLGFGILAGTLVVTALALAPLWRGHLPPGRGEPAAATGAAHRPSFETSRRSS
jgi:sugar phosphate permease